MLQLQNEAPFAATIGLFPDTDGVETLYVVVRATFALAGSALKIAEKQRPIRLVDEYRGDPARSSLAHAGEMHLQKPSTDVVLLGDAWAPQARPASECDVMLRVGEVRKVVRVFGDREWKGALGEKASSPAPFTRMPLVYERAFGGVLELDPETKRATIEPRNPAGVGFARRGKQGEPAARQLPNIEDPAHLIAHPSDTPPPAGFGYIAPAWEPRRSFAGTYDDAWRKTRAPYLPQDFNPRFFNVAHPDLVCRRYLEGGEPVEIVNASPAGILRFRLPRCQLGAEVRIAGAIERPALRLETVVLEPNDGVIGLLWRGAIRCDKRSLKIDRVRIGLNALDVGARSG
ncbi:DUF2169 family type VI secretion system accessory protein [Sorangium sp. So ce1099]|uniref:DUF2169 family type VI secretion system accessory protein n=1 Tax=Sorangium sp. So ce1099 TaxID=3133331 RepID=UPI003F609E4C